MKERKVIQKVQGFRTIDGAGVSLVRVLGSETVYDFDPFLMLDSFDSTNPDDYRRGFPEHPHRGIETVSFIAKGNITHKDHLGSKATIGEGAEVMLMSAPPVNEPIAWHGPIVMNEEHEIRTAVRELRSGSFLKTGIKY